MPLVKLEITDFRNLSSASLALNPSGLNIFIGKNGSGKTSILEAVYYLGLGRSFRSAHVAHVIQYTKPAFTLFGELLENQTVGIERSRSGDSLIKINRQPAASLAELSLILPIQLLTPHVFHLLELGPQSRREFLDWGVFHVEHSFIHTWRRFKLALRQRNAALRSPNTSNDEVLLWDHELAASATEIHAMRESYLIDFKNFFEIALDALLPLFHSSIELKPGWDITQDYRILLREELQKDRLMGFTQHGPHRADLKILVDGKPAAELLSRGQQKLCISAMKLAQASLLKQRSGQQCIFLLDDITSELDIENQRKIIQLLEGDAAQVFITALSGDFTAGCCTKNIRMFHVEHGLITEAMA